MRNTRFLIALLACFAVLPTWGQSDDIYSHLQRAIASSLRRGDAETAAVIAEQFRKNLGNDYRYQNIMQALTQPLDSNFYIEPLPTTVNTPTGSEYAPALSTDETQLYFCGRKRIGNTGYEDIFLSEYADGEWQQAAPITDRNTRFGSEAPEAVSPDGQQLIIFKDGILCTSDKTSTGWTTPIPLPAKINISEWQADAMISSDGQALLFAARKATDREDTPSMNIYVSLLDSAGEWGEPFELGPGINTQFDERAPYLHADMRTLYFSSVGHGSLGGFDVFRAQRIGDGWDEWTTPENFGREVNTSDNECWYKISRDGTTAYCSMLTNGQQDIYRMSVPMRMRPNKVTTVYGVVTDIKGDPVQTEIRWENLEKHTGIGHVKIQNAEGSYTRVLPQGCIYGYFIDDQRYFPKADYINLKEGEMVDEIERNIVLISYEQMINEGLAIALNNVFFDTDKADLLPISIPELKRLAAIVNRLEYRVEISGHTDNSGGYQHNVKLSKMRANSVRDFLIEQGCDPNRFLTVGYGPDRPIDTNDTPEGRQQNRRVEIRFLKK